MVTICGNRMTQNYSRDNNNLSCICNNLVLSREELFYGFARGGQKTPIAPGTFFVSGSSNKK